ncbi:MAG: hypothetical protein ACFBSG_09810 [Leptolyngbyaceae cyanobacterium]
MSVMLGAGLAYVSTPRPIRSLIPDAALLRDWHVSIIAALVVNREVH